MDIDHLINELTLEEKASLVSGGDFWNTTAIPRLGIPSILMTDGPHGLRKEIGAHGGGLVDSIPATSFPTASCLASSWNRDLLFEVGRAIAEEAIEEQVSVVLGPGANIKRSPLCGRNFEYFSEDPFLSGQMARSWIDGVQSLGIGASLKHFAANNQETRRMTIDAVVDERALREIYLRGFEIAVRGSHPWTVMAAYNRLNGDFCAENPVLLEQILREEWGFDGLVVSDWGATNNRVAGLKAGLDLEMPGVPNGNTGLIVAAVKSGTLDEKELDRRVRKVLEMVDRSQKALSEDFRYDRNIHHDLARRAAVEGAVLLKNKDDLLPLNKDQKIALIGEFARSPRYQGSGSSYMNPSRLDSLYGEMAKILDSEHLSFSPGYEIRDIEPNDQLIKEAVQVAQKSDVVVICAGLTDLAEVEGLDRENMCMPAAHNALIDEIAAVCPHVVVVLSNGAPVEMPWEPQVGAILEGYLGGQAGGGALADILFGKISPSGKLAETFPLKLEDNPSFHNFPGGPRTVEYRESIYVGYRFYDKVDKDVLYPFGYGLSYTSFEYSGLKLEKQSINLDEMLKISFDIKNTGKMRGQEIAQVYVRNPHSNVFRPEKELAGFARLDLKPGEQKTAQIEIEPRSFAYYDVKSREWVVQSGDYDILVGASSRDIRLNASVHVKGLEPSVEIQNLESLVQYFSPPADGNFSADGFEALLGHPLPDNSPVKRGQFTINTPVEDMLHTLVGRLLSGYLNREVGKLIQGFEDSPNALMIKRSVAESPMRSILMHADERINRGMVDGLLMLMNGHIFRGLFKLVKSLKNSGKMNKD